MQVDHEKCIGCGTCVRDCPTGAVRLVHKKAVIAEACTECGACIRVCEQAALRHDPSDAVEGTAQCDACPINCRIKEGYQGACQRYKNTDGTLVRLSPLHSFAHVEATIGPEPAQALRQPLVTGIGAGTTYPDCKPAPFIVTAKRDDVDVVTVVTEAPLSYSSMMMKIDTDVPVGPEGATVAVGERKVGMVATEQYGSKMLSIGGVNLLTGKNGLLIARTMSDFANKKSVTLRIEDGPRLKLQVGRRPIIDGHEPENMRVGCGSATLGLFAPLLKDSADEVIVLDSHITGLLSEHAAGTFVGVKPAGVRVRFKQSTPGRYFGDHGRGWGGTTILDPRDVIAGVDEQVATVGMRILVTETTGRRAALFELEADGELREIPVTEAARKALEAIASSCEPSLVSGIYMGGAGGSARAGVTRYPVKLTQAVHAAKANLTVGGAPTFVLPGGGINFMVDVGRVQTGFFYWTPTPAIICPIEYTMTLSDYEEMGGHLQAMKPFDALAPRVLD
jgi:NAD-dependent dihydropyrimidine dehydrogenase PreA subunit